MLGAVGQCKHDRFVLFIIREKIKYKVKKVVGLTMAKPWKISNIRGNQNYQKQERININL